MTTRPLMSCSTSVRHRVKHVCKMCSSSLVTKRGQGPASSAVPLHTGYSVLAGEADGESITTLTQQKSFLNDDYIYAVHYYHHHLLLHKKQQITKRKPDGRHLMQCCSPQGKSLSSRTNLQVLVLGP